MDQENTVTRELDLDMGVDELWGLVSDGDRWADWLVDDADLDVVNGGRGVVVDDGVTLEVAVERVERDRGVRFTWWPSDGPDRWSTVELIVVPLQQGSRLRITEVMAATQTIAMARQWEIRALMLWACSASLVSV
jgi:uncharacterized protein YndB with AHSA1/START domain